MFRALTCARRVQPTLIPALPIGRRYLSRGLYKECPSCGAPLPTLLPACPKCRFIASIPQEIPRHEVFNLDYSNPFEVDESTTKNTFRQLQKVVHPDLWSASDKQDRALQLSAYVNESYKMLLDPIARAEYILGLNGHALGETDRLDDEEFLADTMEQRFAVEEAESREDADEIKSNNQQKLDEIMPSLSVAIREGRWSEAKELTIRLKYLRNIIRAAETWPETSSDH